MRTYRFPDCPDLPSVTTILHEVWPRPRLTQWMLGEVANYATDAHERSVRDGTPWPSRDALIGAATAKRDAAGLRGRRVHAVAEAICLGLPMPDVAPEHEGYVLAIKSFLSESGAAMLASEMVVRDRTGPTPYAGTLDAVMTIDVPGHGRRNAVVDWKTSALIFAEHHVQVAAYAAAPECRPHPLGSVGPMSLLEIETGFVVRLTPTGSYAAEEVDLSAGLETWRAVCRVWEASR